MIGSVASIGHTKSATYLNFGTDYRSDFTVRIGKNVLAANPDLARTLDGLTAKTVIVRGWIDRRNGPLIDVADPSQIELIDTENEPSAVSERSTPGEAQPARAPADASPEFRGFKRFAPGAAGRCGTGRCQFVAREVGFAPLCGGLADRLAFGQSAAFGALRQDVGDALHGTALVKLFDGGEFACHAVKRVLVELALGVRLFGLSLGAIEIAHDLGDRDQDRRS